MREEDLSTARKRNLIELIDFEINQANKEQKRPGWSPWALLGAFVTLCYLLISNINLDKADWSGIGFVFLAFSLVIEFVRELPSFINRKIETVPPEARFQYSSSWGSERFSRIAVLVQYVLLFYLSIKFSTSVPLIPRIATWVSLGPLILLLLVMIILSFRRILTKNLYNWLVPVLSSVIMISFILAILGYSQAIIQNIDRLFPSMKAAGILVLIANVLRLLAEMPVGTPVIQSFLSIRRDLCLDRIDIETATRRIDVILSGMQAVDVLHEPIGDFLRLYDELNDIIRQWVKLQDEAEERIANKPMGISNKERQVEAMLIGLRLDGERELRKRSSIIINRIQKKRKAFDNTVAGLVRMEDSMTGAALAVGERLNEDYLKAQSQISERNAKSDIIKEKLKAFKAQL